jgi:hypothetical protein
MVHCKVGIACDESEERGDYYSQRSFSNHIFVYPQLTFRALPVVIRLALQISFATLAAALLLRSGASGDITALAARVKSTASCGLSK